jgi:hypothetical protein
MEFRQPGIPSTWNSINTEFRRHGILHIVFTFVYSVCYAIHFRLNSDGIMYKKTRNSVEFRGISRILRASLEYLTCKFVRLKSEICRLAEVEPASFCFVR